MTTHRRTMRSRLLILGAVLLGAWGVVFFFSISIQPSYEGRTLRAWLRDFPLAMDPAGNSMWPLSPEDQKAVETAGHAVRMMGRDAYAVLNSELQATDSRIDVELFNVFNRWYKYLRYEHDYVPAYVRRCRALSAVAELGSEASRFVPTIKHMTEDGFEHEIVRIHARAALENLAAKSLTPAEAK